MGDNFCLVFLSFALTDYFKLSFSRDDAEQQEKRRLDAVLEKKKKEVRSRFLSLASLVWSEYSLNKINASVE